MRRIESANVQLVNDKIRELRCHKSGLVPGKRRVPHDAIRTIGRKLTRIWIAFVTRTRLPIDPELVTLSILHAGDKTAPVTVAM